MSLLKRSRVERDASPSSDPTGPEQRLYLIFDDWYLGYSIREIELASAGAEQRPLPSPLIRLEAMRGRPDLFAAVGTKILAMHPRYDFCDAGSILPIFDVRKPGLYFAPPGDLHPVRPIYLPVGDDELFALDLFAFKMLSMKPLSPLRQQFEHDHQSWVDLPMPRTLFRRMDVTSYTVDSDGQTILFSTANATFSFDPQRCEWKKRAGWSLPFSGRANFVRGLDVFVGLPKDVDADYSGRLCFCKLFGDDKRVWLSKENLSSNVGAGNHVVGATLVYLRESSFCLVESVSNGYTEAVQKWKEKWEELLESDKSEELDQILEGCPITASCRLTTFSLSSDMNGDLTASKTAVQCYNVPLEATCNLPLEATDNSNPVAFWL